MAMFSWLRLLFHRKAGKSLAADSTANARIQVTASCPDCGGHSFRVRRTNPTYARMTCATCGSSFEVPHNLVADTGT